MTPFPLAHRFEKISALAIIVATLGLASCAAVPTPATETPIEASSLASAETL